MRADEILGRRKKLRMFQAKIKVKNVNYTNIIDTTIMARNPEMARRLLRRLYGGRSVLVGTPKELK